MYWSSRLFGEVDTDCWARKMNITQHERRVRVGQKQQGELPEAWL